MRKLTRRPLLGALCAGLMALGAGTAPAQAAFDDPVFVFTPEPPEKGPPIPPPTGYFNDPCGLTVGPTGNFYVSDYYHHTIDVFSSGTSYITQLTKVDPLDGPCGLALDASSNLYVNNFHRNVEKFTPSASPPTPSTTYTPAGVFDSSHPTGVAVDSATDNVYVDDRTYIAAYDSSGAPILDGADPLRIGVGSLADGYGLAISRFPATAGRLYVPDYADNTVKVYDPALDTVNPVDTISGPPGGGFVSLHDSAVAVDNVTGEVYVIDTLGPQFSERPQATIYVFDATGAYKGRLKHNVIDGGPSGLAVDNSATATQGRVYVTSGNTELASVYAYPRGAATNVALPPLLTLSGPSPSPTGSAPPQVPAAVASPAAAAGPAPVATASEIAQKGNLQVNVSGKLSPRRLPRRGTAPISVSVGGRITTTDKSLPPQLKTLRIELNRNGRLDYAGLPNCVYNRIQPGSSSRALSSCRSSLVGKGSFTANITLAGQEPYPTKGRLLVFNSVRNGKPVLFGHIYSPKPFATSFVIVFRVQRLGKGTYGTALNAPLPKAMDAWGRLTGLEMTLSRRYSYRGERHSYISAGCPAPRGFPGAVFPLARTSFSFDGGTKLSSVLTSICKVRG